MHGTRRHVPILLGLFKGCSGHSSACYALRKPMHTAAAEPSSTAPYLGSHVAKPTLKHMVQVARVKSWWKVIACCLMSMAYVSLRLNFVGFWGLGYEPLAYFLMLAQHSKKVSWKFLALTCTCGLH